MAGIKQKITCKNCTEVSYSLPLLIYCTIKGQAESSLGANKSLDPKVIGRNILLRQLLYDFGGKFESSDCLSQYSMEKLPHWDLTIQKISL